MNLNMLKYEIAEAGFKLGDVGKKLHLSPAAFSNKINGKNEFTLSEARILAQLLSMNGKDIVDIFFGKDVAQ